MWNLKNWRSFQLNFIRTTISKKELQITSLKVGDGNVYVNVVSLNQSVPLLAFFNVILTCMHYSFIHFSLTHSFPAYVSVYKCRRRILDQNWFNNGVLFVHKNYFYAILLLFQELCLYYYCVCMCRSIKCSLGFHKEPDFRMVHKVTFLCKSWSSSLFSGLNHQALQKPVVTQMKSWETQRAGTVGKPGYIVTCKPDIIVYSYNLIFYYLQ